MFPTKHGPRCPSGVTCTDDPRRIPRQRGAPVGFPEGDLFDPAMKTAPARFKRKLSSLDIHNPLVGHADPAITARFGKPQSLSRPAESASKALKEERE